MKISMPTLFIRDFNWEIQLPFTLYPFIPIFLELQAIHLVFTRDVNLQLMTMTLQMPVGLHILLDGGSMIMLNASFFF